MPRRCSPLSWGANTPSQDSGDATERRGVPARTYTLFGGKKALLIPNISILWLFCSRNVFGGIKEADTQGTSGEMPGGC